MQPYYQDATCTIYHGDARELALSGDVMVTDPPFGIAYESGAPRLAGNARSIAGDLDTSARDDVLRGWDGPALVFGSPKAPEPDRVRARLIWDQGGALGMGDLSLPWKPSWQFIYVLGGPWDGRRDCGSVIQCPPVQSVGRLHPHEKPVGLLQQLLLKCVAGTVVDPFMGSGSTLVAAREMGRTVVGADVDESYCEIAARRLSTSLFSAVS